MALISAQDFLDNLRDAGVLPINNLLFSGRMPPGHTAPMYPTGLDLVFRESPDNMPIARLGQALPNTPALQNNFKLAAAESVVPEPVPGLNMDMKPSQ